MTKLERLAAACKGSVSLEANPHRDVYYKSAQDWLTNGLECHRPAEGGACADVVWTTSVSGTWFHDRGSV